MRNCASLKPYPQRELLRILLNGRNIEITSIACTSKELIHEGERNVFKMTIQSANVCSILMYTVLWEPKGETPTTAESIQDKLLKGRTSQWVRRQLS